MVFATVGWGAWWVTLFLHRLAPELAPSILTTSIIACVFAAVGFFLAVFTLRAKRIWVLLVTVPMFANGSLLVMPWIVTQADLTGQGSASAPANEP